MATVTAPMTGAEFLARTSRQDFRVANFTPVGNEACAAAMREKARGASTSRHTRKDKKGTRASNLRRALKDY